MLVTNYSFRFLFFNSNIVVVVFLVLITFKFFAFVIVEFLIVFLNKSKNRIEFNFANTKIAIVFMIEKKYNKHLTLFFVEKQKKISKRYVTKMSIKYSNEIIVVNLYHNIFLNCHESCLNQYVAKTKIFDLKNKYVQENWMSKIKVCVKSH